MSSTLLPGLQNVICGNDKLLKIVGFGFEILLEKMVSKGLFILTTARPFSRSVHFQSFQDDEEVVPFDGQPSSFPKDFGYGAFDGDQETTAVDHKPRILLMGLRRYCC